MGKHCTELDVFDIRNKIILFGHKPAINPAINQKLDSIDTSTNAQDHTYMLSFTEVLFPNM